jgi:hypothetical protein
MPARVARNPSGVTWGEMSRVNAVIPLLPPGLHEIEWEELRRLCVDDFPNSTRRSYLAEALEEIFDGFTDFAITCEVWIDGSFVTTKLDPADVDMVFVIDSGVVATADEAALAWVNRVAQNLRDESLCDTYVSIRFPKEHPDFDIGFARLQYWLSVFGYHGSSQEKGIAVVRTGEP